MESAPKSIWYSLVRKPTKDTCKGRIEMQLACLGLAAVGTESSGPLQNCPIPAEQRGKDFPPQAACLVAILGAKDGRRAPCWHAVPCCPWLSGECFNIRLNRCLEEACTHGMEGHPCFLNGFPSPVADCLAMQMFHLALMPNLH